MQIKKTYFDFADDDFKYLNADYKEGRVANYMLSMAQSICERYLKHIIDKYVEILDDDNERENQEYLHQYSLNLLISYVLEHTDMEISEAEKQTILKADGYCFSALYPGYEAINISKELMDECMSAVYKCREKVLVYCMKKESELLGN